MKRAHASDSRLGLTDRFNSLREPSFSKEGQNYFALKIS